MRRVFALPRKHWFRCLVGAGCCAVGLWGVACTSGAASGGGSGGGMNGDGGGNENGNSNNTNAGNANDDGNAGNANDDANANANANANGNGGDDVVCDVGMDNAEATVSYSLDVVPILEQSGCFAAGCHGEPPTNNYQLLEYERSFQAGQQALDFDVCPIVPGDPDASYIIEKLSENPRFGTRMPNNRPPLADEDIELIRTWIAEGAPNN